MKIKIFHIILASVYFINIKNFNSKINNNECKYSDSRITNHNVKNANNLLYLSNQLNTNKSMNIVNKTNTLGFEKTSKIKK